MKKKPCAGTYTKTMAFACLLLALTQNGCVKPVERPGTVNSPTPKATSGAVTGTAEPTPTQEVQKGPENTPVPTATPEPVKTPEASASPAPTSKPVAEPTPTEWPEPTKAVTEERVTPAPLPTEAPDYVTLLQNGWQRAEDFFGYRELIFPGRLNRTELFTEEGRYEYRYTSDTEEAVVFYVIGETEVSVQPFLDGLEQNRPDCRITAEGEDDYTYTYTDGALFVKGRVYSCDSAAGTNRMRVELHYPTERLETEGYEFYLK